MPEIIRAIALRHFASIRWNARILNSFREQA